MRLDFSNYCHNVSSNYFIKKSWLYMTLKMSTTTVLLLLPKLLWSIIKHNKNTKDKIHKTNVFLSMKDSSFNTLKAVGGGGKLFFKVFQRLIAPFIIALKHWILQHLVSSCWFFISFFFYLSKFHSDDFMQL